MFRTADILRLLDDVDRGENIELRWLTDNEEKTSASPNLRKRIRGCGIEHAQTITVVIGEGCKTRRKKSVDGSKNKKPQGTSRTSV